LNAAPPLEPVTVYISIGSNLDRRRHILASLDELRRLHGAVEVSPVYESAAIDCEGGNFYNLVAGFSTRQDWQSLRRELRRIEEDHGRKRNAGKCEARTLDLDLLLYGDWQVEDGKFALPRSEILRYAFVLRPLADIAPSLRHPALGRSYAELWAEMQVSSPPLWEVKL
jgi:2-amino-4-hydroxy-6-hydroxymethyldihydropteridine diphosphokinase